MKLTIYRYDPDKDAKPYYQDYDVPIDAHDRMLLDALVKAKAIDDSLPPRLAFALQIARDGVGVEDVCAFRRQHAIQCGLASGDVAGDPDHVHVGPRRPDLRGQANRAGWLTSIGSPDSSLRSVSRFCRSGPWFA